MPLHMVTRGAKSGPCNICGVDGPLTEDHTPPKGCARPTAMELQHVAHRLDAQRAIKTKANDGVKYRTLCARCNCALLGGRYDPVLIDFTSQVSRLLASNLTLPATMTVPTKPALLMRAIWGHLAAVGVDRYLKGPRTEEWRNFFLNATLSVPAGVNFYFWVYPYRRQVLVRDATCMDISNGGKAMYWLMKFYPMAFAVWMDHDTWALSYRNLASYRTSNPDDVVDVMVDLEPLPHELTLEAPTTTQAIMFGRDAIVANCRAPRGRILKI